MSNPNMKPGQGFNPETRYIVEGKGAGWDQKPEPHIPYIHNLAALDAKKRLKRRKRKARAKR